MRDKSIAFVCSSLLLASSGVVLAMGNKPVVDLEAASQRILPVAQVKLAPPAVVSAKDRSGDDLYKAACSACHDTGAANAPKLGDKAAWAPRLKLGLEGLVKSATAGKNAMPPNGGSDASEQEMTRAVIYIANKSGANFK